MEFHAPHIILIWSTIGTMSGSNGANTIVEPISFLILRHAYYTSLSHPGDASSMDTDLKRDSKLTSQEPNRHVDQCVHYSRTIDPLQSRYKFGVLWSRAAKTLTWGVVHKCKEIEAMRVWAREQSLAGRASCELRYSD